MVRNAITNWAGIQLAQADPATSIRWIKRRRWKKFKEVAAAIVRATIYYTWKARN